MKKKASGVKSLKISKMVLAGSISLALLTSVPINVLAAGVDYQSAVSTDLSTVKEDYDIKKLIPKKLAESSTSEFDKLEAAVSYGILETVSRVIADKDSVWAELFKNGMLDIKQIVPIKDFENNLAEVMLIFEEGYLIVDADNGALIQYSYGAIDAEYFNQSDEIYVDGLEHFSVSNGVIKDGRNENKGIDEVKSKIKKERKEKQINKKWGIPLDKKLQKSIIQGYGANEGTSRRNYITNPVTWLTNYYGSGYGIWYSKGYSLSVPEILQSGSSYPESNDCALISTLEIINYYSSTTQTQRNTAYTAMKNSSYFDTVNGVYWNDNNNLFKIAAEAIGSPWSTQSTTDDIEDYVNTNNYDYIYDKLYHYGPGYISMNQAPYGAHTVTFKGVKRYVVDWTTAQGAYYSNFEDFVTINDHWSTTTGDAYLSIQGGNLTWYFTSVVPN